MEGLSWPGSNPGPGSETSTRTRSGPTSTRSPMVDSGPRPAWRPLFVTSSLTSSRMSSSTGPGSSRASRRSAWRAIAGDSGDGRRWRSITAIAGPFRQRLFVQEVQALVEQRDPEDAVDRRRSGDDHQAPSLPAGPRVGPQDRAEARGVDERQLAEVQDHRRWVLVLDLRQALLHVRRGSQVELALQPDPGGAVPIRDVDVHPAGTAHGATRTARIAMSSRRDPRTRRAISRLACSTIPGASRPAAPRSSSARSGSPRVPITAEGATSVMPSVYRIRASPGPRSTVWSVSVVSSNSPSSVPGAPAASTV